MRNPLHCDGGSFVPNVYDAKWKLALLRSVNKIDAVCMNIARSLGMSPLRYNEIAIEVNRLIDSTSGPTEFWGILDESRRKLFLNDVDSVLFGAMVCNIISCTPKSVYFGKTLAKINHVDYDEIVCGSKGV